MQIKAESGLQNGNFVTTSSSIITIPILDHVRFRAVAQSQWMDFCRHFINQVDGPPSSGSNLRRQHPGHRPQHRWLQQQLNKQRPDSRRRRSRYFSYPGAPDYAPVEPHLLRQRGQNFSQHICPCSALQMRASNSTMIGNRIGLEELCVLDQQIDRFFAVFRRTQRIQQNVF